MKIVEESVKTTVRGIIQGLRKREISETKGLRV